jgi:isopenicillin-N epimerase
MPIRARDQIVNAVVNELSNNTRLLLIDHITSPTGLIFPIEPIVQACNQRGIEILIDGAHAPGMIDLNISAIGATYYAGNLHKWCCAPKGSAFLWVQPARRADIHPCIISHHYGEGLAEEFAWQGTRDVSAWLAIPAALRFMSNLGWPRIREHNHSLAVWAHQMLVERLNVEPLTPLDGKLLGATATLPLPGRLANLSEAQSKALQQSLYTNHAIEVPLFYWQNRWHLRVSCQVYNEQSDYERLANAISSLR